MTDYAFRPIDACPIVDLWAEPELIYEHYPDTWRAVSFRVEGMTGTDLPLKMPGMVLN